jgi:hypothetical protein
VTSENYAETILLAAAIDLGTGGIGDADRPFGSRAEIDAYLDEQMRARGLDPAAVRAELGAELDRLVDALADPLSGVVTPPPTDAEIDAAMLAAMDRYNAGGTVIGPDGQPTTLEALANADIEAVTVTVQVGEDVQTYVVATGTADHVEVSQAEIDAFVAGLPDGAVILDSAHLGGGQQQAGTVPSAEDRAGASAIAGMLEVAAANNGVTVSPTFMSYIVVDTAPGAGGGLRAVPYGEPGSAADVAGFSMPNSGEWGLQDAGRNATAEHLSPNVQGYTEVNQGAQQVDFLSTMRAAIDTAVAALRARVGSATNASMRAIYDGIATARANLATRWEAPRAAALFGLPALGQLPTDYIQSDGRHQAYFNRAAAVDPNSPLYAPARYTGNAANVIVIEGRVIPLSTVFASPDGDFEIHHPPFMFMEGDPNYDPRVAMETARWVQDYAFGLYAQVMNDPNMSVDQALEKVALASFLLFHYTPNVRGTPAVVASMNDAIMRARFGVTFPPLQPGQEPFWEAIFSGAGGMNDFIAGFREYYEPIVPQNGGG